VCRFEVFVEARGSDEPDCAFEVWWLQTWNTRYRALTDPVRNERFPDSSPYLCSNYDRMREGAGRLLNDEAHIRERRAMTGPESKRAKGQFRGSVEQK
jgi:hypothetical protein